MPTRPSILAGVGLLSCATLALEVGLTRLFAVQQFYHFAFLVISLAVLGLAAGGVILTYERRPPSLPVLACAFASAALGAFVVLQTLPFDSYSIAWDARQVGALALYVLGTGAPFFFSGWATAACLAAAGTRSRLPYAASLLGGALGGPLALGMAAATTGEAVIFIAGALGLAAAAAFSSSGRVRGSAIAVAALLLVPVVRFPISWSLRLSPYKPLEQALQLPSAELRLTDWTGSARLDVVETPALHVFPGLKLNAAVDLPRQTGVFLDGEGPYPLTALDPGSPAAFSLADDLPTGLAYHLRSGARALLLRPGANTEAALALASGAASVTVVFDEPGILDLLGGAYFDSTFGLIADERLTIIQAAPRAALARLPGDFDLVEIALRDPDRPLHSGAFSLNEDYSLTAEAFTRAFDRLAPDGILVVTRWLGTPPSDESRAWATLVTAADRDGLPPVGGRLLAYRSMRTATLLASPSPFTSADLAVTRRYLDESGYDPIYLPDLRAEELNRHNRLPHDTYHEMFSALLADRSAALRASPMDIRPATDDHPFYFQFFRWNQTAEILAQLGRTWQPFGGSGFLVLVALLLIVGTLAVPLVALPAIRWRRMRRAHARRVPTYFAALGFGYLMVEISLIQQMTLLLDRPAYALAAVLTTLLLTSGIGSLLSARLSLRIVLPLLAALIALCVWGLPAAATSALAWPFAARLGLAAILISPLGFLLGVPFARGLAFTSPDVPGAVSMAWAANGAASGVAGVLAALLALMLGLRVTLLAGGLAYVVAWCASPERLPGARLDDLLPRPDEAQARA